METLDYLNTDNRGAQRQEAKELAASIAFALNTLLEIQERYVEINGERLFVK